jgi:tetratricopeptide (TPR) repeat protein
LGLLAVPLAYLPVSNLLVLLPTIRADRLWYLPTLGVCLALGGLSGLLPELGGQASRFRVWFIVGGLAWGLQCYQARAHAFDYTTDLTFWRATAEAAPRSAKAQLNLGVMLGARKQPLARIELTRRATELAPEWPMAHIYLGDALCREKRVAEAWPHYKRGFEKGPNQRGLLALALQCLWDHQAYAEHRIELLDLGEKYPKSWLAYLAHDLDINGETNEGVNPQYRPRSYNQKAHDR